MEALLGSMQRKLTEERWIQNKIRGQLHGGFLAALQNLLLHITYENLLLINTKVGGVGPGSIFIPGPGPEALCLCEGEGEGQSLVFPCEPCWAPGPWAVAGADPGLLPPTVEGGLHADPGGGHLQSGSLVWVYP